MVAKRLFRLYLSHPGLHELNNQSDLQQPGNHSISHITATFSNQIPNQRVSTNLLPSQSANLNDSASQSGRFAPTISANHLCIGESNPLVGVFWCNLIAHPAMANIFCNQAGIEEYQPFIPYALLKSLLSTQGVGPITHETVIGPSDTLQHKLVSEIKKGRKVALFNWMVHLPFSKILKGLQSRYLF
jgi:hypothetical protein